MLRYQFDIEKVLEIISFFLSKNSNKINYTKLTKLLYIADKRFLEKWDYTITGDYYCSMKEGPVLSRIYDLIKNRGAENYQKLWNSCFVIYEKFFLTFVEPLPFRPNKLSKAEIDVLSIVDEEFKDYSEFEMCDYTHDDKLFPEVKWKEAKEQGNTSLALGVEEILRSLKRSEDEIKKIKNENFKLMQEHNRFKKLGLI